MSSKLWGLKAVLIYEAGQFEAMITLTLKATNQGHEHTDNADSVYTIASFRKDLIWGDK